MRKRLVERGLLDPREKQESEANPLREAVNLPFSELPERTFELPPKEQVIQVADTGFEASEAVEWLRTHGRQAQLTSRFEYAPFNPQEIGRLWQPMPFVSQIAPPISPGRVVDFGCGSGRDCVFLASLGWQATGIDHREEALEHARRLEEACREAVTPIRWRRADVEQIEPDQTYDLAMMMRFLDRPLLARLEDWVRSGGSVLLETFTTIHREKHGKPLKNRFVLEPGEIKSLFTGWDVRYHEEDWRGDAHTARLWATRR